MNIITFKDYYYLDEDKKSSVAKLLALSLLANPTPYHLKAEENPPKHNITITIDTPSMEEFIDEILKHENLKHKQTPFRITNPKMKSWTTIHGFEIDHTSPSMEERKKNGTQNFIYLKNHEDVKKAVRKQFEKYIYNPEKYGLPPNPTIRDIITIFDQSNSQGKMMFLKKKFPNINFDVEAINLK